MALYLGSTKSKISKDKEDLKLILYRIIKVKSLDDFILKDKDNLYVTAKEGKK